MYRFPVRNVYASTIPNRHVYEPVRRKNWGPLLWKTMHSFGRLLKEVEDGDTRQVLTQETSSLFDVLFSSIPCPSCKNHAVQYKMSHPIGNAVTKADVFEEWAYLFHNEVNMRIKHVMIGREDANRLYAQVDPLKTLEEYLQSINAKIRHGMNESAIKERARQIVSRIVPDNHPE